MVLAIVSGALAAWNAHQQVALRKLKNGNGNSKPPVSVATTLPTTTVHVARHPRAAPSVHHGPGAAPSMLWHEFVNSPVPEGTTVMARR